MKSKPKASLLVIFTTVFLDLIGFGMVIPLIGLFGRTFEVPGWQLGLLGASYSLMQFFFGPLLGSLSDRYGRRPILLLSLLGSTLSYLGFALVDSFFALLMTRIFAGIFSANISVAQAYIADITTPQERVKGMGLIGAAFGIGFTLGPPMGGILAHHYGIQAPGFVAALLCGLNFFLAWLRLPESYPPEKRTLSALRIGPALGGESFKVFSQQPALGLSILTYFLVTFAFSNMEQTFSLLFQEKFSLEPGVAGYKTGLVLMWSGFIGAVIQGGWIRKYGPKFGEVKLLSIGLLVQSVAMLMFPFGPEYFWYFVLVIPIAVGSSLINPSVSALVSKSASESEQGMVFGFQQGAGSLARALGPFIGLMTFTYHHTLPFMIAGIVTLLIGVMVFKNSSKLLGVQNRVHS